MLQLYMTKPWDIVDRTDLNFLSTTWEFNVKRYPGGHVRKLKTQCCASGFEQIRGIYLFASFAQVVTWTTVRLLLNLAS